MKYLHSMVRVGNLDQSLRFYQLLGLTETFRTDVPEGRFTLVFLAADVDLDSVERSGGPCLELTYNWDAEAYSSGRAFGHLAYQVDDIYKICSHLAENGITINRPPRDGRMAFVKSPDGISIELLQRGDPLQPCEPWISAENIGSW